MRIFVDDDGVVWIGNGEQLIRYDPRIVERRAGFSALVRKVVSPVTEEVFYGGALHRDGSVLRLAYVDNDLSFEVAAPSYNNPSANVFQYYLEGNDEEWSEWTSDNSINYRDLWEGRYVLRVRARNGQGVVGREATFAFRVLPPWYRTWWAYGFYFVVLLGLSALSWNYYHALQENKRAREQAKELERERVARARLKQANDRLQQANDSLTQVNRLKDEFLANTSHELRTPLTAILGFSALLKEELSADYFDMLDPIESNGQRLLRTVNSLLEIAKLRAGMMEVYRTEMDLGEQAAEIVRSLAPLARQKDLLLELRRPAQPLYVRLDPRYLERILDNLVGNAIKFTREGGVTVAVEKEDGWVSMHVIDTGIGIDEAFLPHLFDEFKQESTGLSRTYEGTGLGLAITARLVRLMDGQIQVQSEKGKGSTFTIRFPVHVSEEQDPPPGEPLPEEGQREPISQPRPWSRPSPAV